MLLNESEVRVQLERILVSPGFATSARSAQFLKFCVEQTLEGKHEAIKESTVGVEVFGRIPGYDPKADPIVRVHARRVREKLESYYSAVGTADPIEIQLPKGTYIPKLAKRLPLRRTDFMDMETVANVSVAPVKETRKPHNRLWIWLALIMGLAALSGSLYLRHSKSSSPFNVTGEFTPFTFFPGSERNPAWSPDGKTLAYSWNRELDGVPHIYLQKVGETEPHKLTDGLAPEFRPAWSPDGSEIAFIRPVALDHFEVIRRNLASGLEKVCAVFPYFWPLSEDHPALDWSPDGKELLVSEQPSPSVPVRLVLLSVATGEWHPLTDPPYGTSGDIEGKFSPDGKFVALRRGGLGELYRVSISGETKQPATRLTFDNRGVRGIAWSHDGMSILYGSHRDPAGYGLWEIAFDGAQKELTPYGFESISPAVSGDGKYLALERREHIINLVKEPLSGTAAKQVLTPSSHLDYAPAYSPDGQKIAFISTRSGADELWMEHPDGSDLKQLTHLNGKGIPLTVSWSPDSRKILASIRLDGPTNIFLFDIQSNQMRQLTHTRDRYIFPLYSRDGKSIYFSSNAQGQSRIWHLSLDGTHEPEQMFGDPAIYFQQSEDGRYLYFCDPGPVLRILRRDLKTGELKAVFQNASLVPFRGFLLHRNLLYVLLSQPDAGGTEVLSVDLASGSAKRIMTLDHVAEDIASGSAISPDGKTLLVSETIQDNSDIYLMPVTH